MADKTKLEMDSLNTEHQKLLEKANASVANEIEKAQQDRYYPTFHLRPQANWINDPNGPIYFNGEYHMFFQHNPYGKKWGNMSWAHAVSKDMVHWRHLPIALTPNPQSYDKDGVYSGCCVIHDGVPTIMYTGTQPEVQCIAQSFDNMRTWIKHPANPVITSPPMDELDGFRDPFAWKEGNDWYCVIGSGIRGQGGTALLYRSQNMVDWEFLNPLCIGFGRMWECPNFFPLGDKWVLAVSPYGEVQYTIGDYKDHQFYPGEWQRMDFGHREGFYAPNCLEDAQGRRVMWGWIQGDGSDDAPWNGMLSLPRVLSLRPDGKLGVEPLPELRKLRKQHQQLKNVALEPERPLQLPEFSSDTFEMLVEFKPGNAAGFGIDVLCSPDGKEKTTLYYDALNQVLKSGEHAGYFQLLPGESTLTLHVFVDKSVVEVYANSRATLTFRVYPQRDDCLGLQLFSNKRNVIARSVDVWELGSIYE